MKIQFDPKDENQVALAKAMGSKNKSVSWAAQETFAALMGALIAEIYWVAGTSNIFYKPFTYNEESGPSVPVDPLYDWAEKKLSFWSMSMQGGVPTNTVTAPIEELRFQSFPIDTAISWKKTWARKGRLDVLAMFMEALMTEHLIISEQNAWACILAAIANSTNPRTTGKGNIYHTQTAGIFTLDDLNKLFVVFRRQAAAFNGMTPVGSSARPTDLIISPEMEARIRSFAYQPVNTRAANDVTITANSQQSAAAVVTLSDADRAAIYKGGEVPSYFGADLTVINEFGPNQKYTNLAGYFIGGTALPSLQPGGATDTFDPTVDDYIIALDSSKTLGWKGHATDHEKSQALTLSPDDQFYNRSDKQGLYGGSEESVIAIETRGAVGLMV